MAWGEYGFAGDVESTGGVAFVCDAAGTWLTWDKVRALHRHLRVELAWTDVPWAACRPPVRPRVVPPAPG